MKHNFEKYCKNYQDIENYCKALKDNFKGWNCHHRLETHNSDGERRLVDITRKELIALNMYYNRPADELIFLAKSEHKSLHKPSAETRKKISDARKGKPKSAETRKKISESQKGQNIWIKCTHWFNNGKINIRAKECPDGFIPGRLLI